MNNRACVCVPARNEQEHLPALMAALATQTYPWRLRVVITLNNCDDASVSIVRAAADKYIASLDIVPDVIQLDKSDAHVGIARERAMRNGAKWLADAGAPSAAQVLLTTDADATPPPDWVSANLSAIDAGADVVGGKLVILSENAFTDELTRHHERNGRYWAAVRKLEDHIDPVPDDPPPRHGDHTGASLAVRRVAYEAVGGIPKLPIGEDTGFVKAAVAAGYRLRHSPDVWIGVSAREDGRTPGGMAAHMRTHRQVARSKAPVLLPGGDQWFARALWRATIRSVGGSAKVSDLESALPPMFEDTPIEDAIAQLDAWVRCS